jgi:hypothetical protein
MFGRRIHHFHFWGVLGFICGVALGIFLTISAGLSPWVLAVLSLCGAATFYGHVYIQTVITGRENLVYYRHEIAIVCTCSLLLFTIHQPVIPFTEITLLGIGTFLAFGRIGCYNVGCCHGRPYRYGVTYHNEHAEAGFPWYYVGIPLFPLPLVEAFFVFLTVAIGAWIFLSPLPSGTVLVWYTCFYGTVRFVLELFRGDTGRPYLLGLSEAQWTTWVLVLVCLTGSMLAKLPFYGGEVIDAAGISLASLVIIFCNKRWKNYQLLNPLHIHQLATGLTRLVREGGVKDQAIQVGTTELGLNYSYGKIVLPKGTVQHFSISNQQRRKYVDTASIQKVAKYVQMIQKLEDSPEIIEKGSGVFQIIFRQSNPTQ